MAKIAIFDNASTFGIIARIAAALSVLIIVRFFYRLYQVRSLFRDAAQKYGIVSSQPNMHPNMGLNRDRGYLGTDLQ